MSKVIKQVFSQFAPKKGSVRMDATTDPTNLMGAIYLNRVALMAVVPDGYIPTKVEVTVKVLETAPETPTAA